MKTNLLFLFFWTALLAAACTKEAYQQPTHDAGADVAINPDHPLRDSIDAIVGKYVEKGLPGVQVAVKNADGWYISNGGYASLEAQSPMQYGQVSWYFSITKIYTAALILKQWESERINLDAPIRQYLPVEVANGIEGSGSVTVRMLLSHTSGIVNVTELPAFQLWQLNRPLEQPTVQDRLEMVYGKPLMFNPGTDFFYSNTNFLLLQLILENVTNKRYEALLREEILNPLHLDHQYFNLSEAQAAQLPFPNYYFDRYANEQLENCSQWNSALANASNAYGGLAGTATDAIRFLEALVKGQVVSQASWNEMRQWVQGKESTQPDYGLGLEYYQYADGNGQFGHEGDGIGCTTQVMYVPDNDTYLYINITAGRQLFGPYLFKTTDFKNELCGFIARQ
ncbi:MAG TPA: serine hydrolase domain-containing protein [Saprospiraceae bacterium]|nr:beta-lactamase family protein [Lewinellaceae bacterium]HQU59318.1 serine hydrolase domain-containing protein [Saprospiraceae bacterium]